MKIHRYIYSISYYLLIAFLITSCKHDKEHEYILLQIKLKLKVKTTKELKQVQTSILME